MALNSQLRIAAAADLHYSRAAQGKCRFLFSHASRSADVLVLCGDLTNHGTAAEARTLAHDLSHYCEIPVIAILGNHDREAGEEAEVASILRDAGVTLLDGTSTIVGDVGFAGACGTAGGFTRLQRKQVTAEAQRQADGLEQALLSLETPHRVALLHYAPICETLEGEPPEIYSRLGSACLERALERGGATVAFHGHAHNGSYAGHTEEGIGVFNVALPVLQRNFPDRPPYVVFRPRKVAEAAVLAHA